jgi:L,D-transpeptidase YcbB
MFPAILNGSHRSARAALIASVAVIALMTRLPHVSALELSGSAAVLQAQISEARSDVATALDLEAIETFYANRDYRPVWVDETGPTRAANAVISTLRQAGDWGLHDSDFRLEALSAEKQDGRWSATDTAAIELEISNAVVRYANHARGGRIPEPSQQLTTYIDRTPNLPDPKSVLDQISQSSNPADALRGYHPQHVQFQRLQAAYAAMRQDLGMGGNIVTVPSRGPTLSPGQSHCDIALIRARLNVPSPEGDKELYDNELVAAVKRFQSDNGLRADGIVGANTRRAFSSRPRSNLPAIAAAMEQWRWMPESLGDTHIFVNIPAFSVDVIDDGEVVHSERVIVGKLQTQTPLFSERMSSIVLRPEWYMPDSIKLQKLLSAQRRGRTLESMGYRVRRNGKTVNSAGINWGRVNISAYNVYQPSGGSNALGAVKFLFPNKHAVYLHDTPQKSLFNSSERTFSAGCVRVRNPLQLAKILLDKDKGEGALNVDRLVRNGKHNNEIAIETSIPVHIGHFTVWANDNGELTYYKDHYGHEQRTRLALEGQWNKIQRGRDHLASVDTSSLRGVSLSNTPRVRVVRDGVAAPFPPAMGVTKVVTPPKAQQRRSRGNTPGDLIRYGFGGF